MLQRKTYLDNLRALTILLLFPFHTFMIYNNWGEPFYVHGAELVVPSVINHVLWVWMMPLLFAVAGISSRYALQKRSAAQYAKERVQKLLVPLVFGILLLLPVQSYIAGLYHGGSSGYLGYFTKLTDFTGYDGAFTPGHLWFILFLFAISMLSLPFMVLYRKRGNGTLGAKTPLAALMLMGILPCLGNVLFDISGKSPTEYLAYFLLGYFFLASDAVQQKFITHRFMLLGISIVASGLSLYFDELLFELASWLAVLAVLGLAGQYLGGDGRVMGYLVKSSFGVYLFHQTWIVVAGYFVLKLTDNYWLQIPLILFFTVFLTFLSYEIARRVPPLRWMLGLKR